MSETPLQERIHEIMHEAPLSLQALSGGMISQVYRVDFAGSPPLVLKTGQDSHDLRIEAYMLRRLRDETGLPAPRVVHAEADLLLMEHIFGSHDLNAASQRHLGRLLAGCHQARGPAYGLERDTLIGPLHQPNAPGASWIAFFREHRLRYMRERARHSRRLPAHFASRLTRLAEDLERYLIEPDHPALIHGDIWRTNILAQGDRVRGIIDPALYYAHNEMELAYMALFDGFDEGLYAAYGEIIPIDADFWGTRQHIYSLYPLLVHVIIFGEKYLPPIDERLKRFGY